MADFKLEVLRSILFGQTTSRSSWDADRRRRYFRILQAKNDSVKIGAEESDFEEIQKWIEESDKDLQEFSKIHRDFELFRSKTLGIYKMPETLLKMTDQTGDIEEIPYIALGAKEGFIEVSKPSQQKIYMVYSDASDYSVSFSLIEKDIDKKAWKQLENAARKRFDDLSRVKKAKLQVVIGTRNVSTLSTIQKP